MASCEKCWRDAGHPDNSEPAFACACRFSPDEDEEAPVLVVECLPHSRIREERDRLRAALERAPEPSAFDPHPLASYERWHEEARELLK